MTDQKKYTLEDDLRRAAYELMVAMNLRALGKDRAALVNRLRKWADGKDPNEFDFQRSYDRGVRRFVRRDGNLTTELYWFKDTESRHPVRDGNGNAWTSRGLHYHNINGHPGDLIAEAPADVQPEDV